MTLYHVGMFLLIVAFRTHPGCCIVFCLCCSLSHHLFVLSIFNGVFSFFIIEYPLRYTAVLYLRQRFPLSIISNHTLSTIKLVLLIGSLPVIRACGFSTLNRSFNPSTSSTYAVSLHTRELIVLAISYINEVYFPSPLVSHVNRIQ